MGSRGLDFAADRDELHERLGGRLPSGALGLFEGEPGSGRSVLAQRITWGALGQGHLCAYLTTEHGTWGFLRQMRSLGYDVDDAVARGKLLVLPGFPTLAARSPPGDALARLAAAPGALWERDLLVLDDLGSLAAAAAQVHGHGAARAQVDALLQRLRAANSQGTTVICTGDRAGPSAGLLAPLRGAAEMLLEMRVEQAGSSLARRVLVRRLAGAQERAGDAFAFRVEPGLGMLVEIRSVA